MSAKHFQRALTVLLIVLCARSSAEAVRPSSVVLILDCSKTMADGIAEGVEDTRWQVATNLLQSFLRDLGESENSRVGLYCIGHRVKWEDDSEQPNLLEQEGYLEASLGFAALKSLVPGDDVERLLPLRPFTDVESVMLAPRITALQPWGERPLNAAIAKALDDLASEPAASNRRIVVLTDGGNQQRLSQSTTSQEMVLAALRKSLVPIHVVYLGGDDERTKDTQRNLRQLAEFAGGSVSPVSTSDDVHLAQLLDARPQSTNIAKDGKEKGTVTSTAGDQPVTQFVSGNVVINGHPVRMATVTLDGSSLAPVNADNTGRFVFHDVPVGHYQVKVQAIVQNRIRKKSQELVVSGDRAAEVSIDVK